MKRVISTDDAPEAVGAYSQGTTDGSLVFTAGQVPLTPDGDLLTDAGIEEQTERALENVLAILEEEGAGPEDILKVTVFLADADDFDAVNATYKGYFDGEFPARSVVEVGDLPLDIDIEIEAVASVPA